MRGKTASTAFYDGTGVARGVVPNMSNQTIRYDDAIVRKFVTATIVWGAVGHAGRPVVRPPARVAEPQRRPVLHVRPAATAAHQRGDLRVRRQRHLRGGLLLVAAAAQGAPARPGCRSSTSGAGRRSSSAAAITLPLGFTQGKEYAELEWPIDLAIAVVWVAFAVNFFAMVRNRREKHLYVALWFYIATIVTVAILHIFNNLVVPAELFKSYSIYAGVAGRVHAVVVRPQRGRVLPDHAVPRPHVLLPAEGGGAAGVQLPAVDPPLLVAGLHLHLGRAAPPALHGAAAVGVDARHDLQRDAVDAVVGRHDQRPAHAARRVEQGRRGSGPQVLRRRASRSTGWRRSRGRCCR